MEYLRDLIPAVSQGLAGLSASRDPAALGELAAAGRDVRNQYMLSAALAAPGLLTGHTSLSDMFDLVSRTENLPTLMEGARRLHPVEVSPVVGLAPAVGAGLFEATARGGSGLSGLTTGLGHAAGATLADALVRGYMGTNTLPGHLAIGRALGGLGGQIFGRTIGRGIQEARDEHASYP